MQSATYLCRIVVGLKHSERWSLFNENTCICRVVGIIYHTLNARSKCWLKSIERVTSIMHDCVCFIITMWCECVCVCVFFTNALIHTIFKLQNVMSASHLDSIQSQFSCFSIKICNVTLGNI